MPILSDFALTTKEHLALALHLGERQATSALVRMQQQYASEPCFEETPLSRYKRLAEGGGLLAQTCSARAAYVQRTAATALGNGSPEHHDLRFGPLSFIVHLCPLLKWHKLLE